MATIADAAKVGPGGSGGRSSRNASSAAAPQMPQALLATRLRCHPTRSSACGAVRSISTRFSASGSSRNGNGTGSLGRPEAATAVWRMSAAERMTPSTKSKPQHQLQVVPGGAHDDRERPAVQDHLERLFGGDDVVGRR